MLAFLGENDEHRLRDFLGLMRVTRLPVRDGINEVDVPLDQAGKSGFGFVFDKLAQQVAVRIRRHYG